MSATPYIPSTREVARHLILRRWIATLCELACIGVFLVACAACGLFG